MSTIMDLFASLSLFASLVFLQTNALDNGLVLTPPMGWMAWERFRCNIDCKNDPHNCVSETLFMEIADRMYKDGYVDAGYDYLMLDDCWMSKKRDANNRLIGDPERFPSGMQFLSDFIHARGIKFGIYEDIGTETCGGYPGIQGFEKQDMQTFADWGVDYVKLDGCYEDPNSFAQAYPQVGKYMNQTGRPMVYSCSWPAYLTDSNATVPWQAIRDNCNLWRNYADIQDSYDTMTGIVNWFAENQDVLIPIAGPGAWNDPDELLIGDFGLSFEQSKTQLAIWAMLAAPLIMSTDLRHIRHEFRKILLNRHVIEINQDSLGIQGKQIINTSQGDGLEVWRRPVGPTALVDKKKQYSYAVDLQLGSTGDQGRPAKKCTSDTSDGLYCMNVMRTIRSGRVCIDETKVVWSKREDGTPYTWSKPLKAYNLTVDSGYLITDLFSNREYGLFRPDDVLSFNVNPSGVVMFKATLAAASEKSLKDKTLKRKPKKVLLE